MSEPLFREAAVAHHRAQAGPGKVLRVGPRWTRVAFWLLALAAVGGLIASALIRVDRVVFVPAVIDGVNITAVVPPALADKAARCGRARMVVPGQDPVDARVTAGALDRLSARAERPIRQTGGTLRLCTGSRALIVDLVPGLGG